MSTQSRARTCVALVSDSSLKRLAEGRRGAYNIRGGNQGVQGGFGKFQADDIEELVFVFADVVIHPFCRWRGREACD